MDGPESPPSTDRLTALVADGACDDAIECLDWFRAAAADDRKRAVRALRDVADEESASFDDLGPALVPYLRDAERAVRLLTAKLLVAVAETLDRTQGTVTETFRRLEDDGLVTYEPYDGVTLTDRGRERAAQLHETYATVLWFFRSVLDLDDHEAEAMELAGLVSPTVAERLAATLPTEVESEPQRDRDGSGPAATEDEST